MRVVLITGISGSGKSIAIKLLEDDGFYCVDNLPVRFVHEVVMSLQDAGHERVAVAVDARSGETVAELRQIVAGLKHIGHDVKVLFLNARTGTLMQRYSETRRRHPMSLQAGPGAPVTLAEAIDRERERMSVLEDIGTSIDTSDLHPNTLREWVRDVVGAERAAMTLLFESFAYKHGIPLDADLVFDVRCLPNPYWDAQLRPLTGLDAPVREYLGSIPSVNRMIEHIAGFLDAWLPSYIQENRSYLTLAVGCTGGQHRSVHCVEALAQRFRRTENVLVRHRSLTMRLQAA